MNTYTTYKTPKGMNLKGMNLKVTNLKIMNSKDLAR